MAEKKTTIKDVATKAGVSTTTVSFVLNNRPDQSISDGVRKKVIKAAKQMGYYPSAIAAGLASKKTRNIGIIFYKDSDLISNEYYSFVLEGVIHEVARHNYNLLFSYVDKDYETERELPKVVREKNIDGVIFVKEINPLMIEDIQKRGIPVVVIDHFPLIKDINSVDFDNFLGSKLATKHLLSLGHKTIHCLYSFGQRPSIKGRIQGFTETMKAHNQSINKHKQLHECADLTFEAGYFKALELLKHGKMATAYVCANDVIAAGVLRAAYELGITIPQELSVTGFDNIAASKFINPSITSIGGNKQNLGSQAVLRLFELIEANPLNKKNIILPVELFKRESTGRAPSKKHVTEKKC